MDTVKSVYCVCRYSDRYVLGSGFGRCNDTLFRIRYASKFHQISDILAVTMLAVFLMRPKSYPWETTHVFED